MNYRGSALSSGSAGKVKGGDRLPWVPLSPGEDNFAPLATLKWQVHVYGEPNAELGSVLRRARSCVAAFPWQSACQEAGLLRNAVYLVRPDGYVAAADPQASAQKLAEYFDRRGIRTA